MYSRAINLQSIGSSIITNYFVIQISTEIIYRGNINTEHLNFSFIIWYDHTSPPAKMHKRKTVLSLKEYKERVIEFLFLVMLIRSEK